MLEISRLAKSFEQGESLAHRALQEINLRVEDREFVSLVGASGCGKSTLLRVVCGLEAATHGSVTLNQRQISHPVPDIAMVFQDPRLMPWLSVRENVRLALLKQSRNEQDALIEDALTKVELRAFADALPRRLSGGMAQRAALARALVRRPSILLLDEPFSALDNLLRLKLQDHLGKLWNNERFSVLLVTHDIEEAVILSDRVIVMRGPPGQIEHDILVDLPRPRRSNSLDVQRKREQIVRALRLD